MKKSYAMRDFHPVVFHVIRTTASAGAPVHRDWMMLARLHEVFTKMRHFTVQAAA